MAQPEKPETSQATPKNVKPIRCFACGDLGHKSNVCPKKKEKVKKLKIPWKDVTELGYADVIGKVNSIDIPVTMDSGADISAVPREVVCESDYMGETSGVQGFFRVQTHKDVPISNVVFDIDGELIPDKAIALPGEDLKWTMLFSVRMRDPTSRE